jgi:hypothetical protein
VQSKLLQCDDERPGDVQIKGQISWQTGICAILAAVGEILPLNCVKTPELKQKFVECFW